MHKDSPIFIAGHRGMVGSAIHAELRAQGCTRLITASHAELDLTDAPAVRVFFKAHRPRYVFLAAARVGGILANQSFPADFIGENLKIQTNTIEACRAAQVERLLFLGSSCIYPRDCPQPIRESYLLTGPLEPTNRPYALAKIAGIEMCWASNRQFGTRYLAAMPTNLYGPNDNFDPGTSHVLAALLRKVDTACREGLPEVAVWGSGTPRREFLHVRDMAQACLHLMQLDNAAWDALLPPTEPPLINIGVGEDLTIRELAGLICDVVGYRGALAFDASKPDGAPRKLLDVTRIRALGWQPRVPLPEGIRATWESARSSW